VATPALAGGAREFAKRFTKSPRNLGVIKKLGVLCALVVKELATA
jgi:hypothetical protein